jgi:hypothetical protein
VSGSAPLLNRASAGPQRCLSTISGMNLHIGPWRGPALSTASAHATRSYCNGVVALVADAAYAEALLLEATAIDPDFHLAQLALAVARAVGGAPFVAPDLRGALTRGERQHAEIVAATFAGGGGHADDLRREHLVEFPGDLLIVWLSTACHRRAER